VLPSPTPKQTLHVLLKSGNPCWTASELKAAKRKLSMIGIASYAEMEEVLLQGKGILNNRLRDQGLKTFSSSTIDRLLTAVLLEQEGQLEAAEETQVKEATTSTAPNSQPFMKNHGTAIAQTDLSTQQHELTLHRFLKGAKPDWTTNALEATIKKLDVIGIVSYSDFEEALLQGSGSLNVRLRRQGLKAFASSTLDRLKSAVRSRQERQDQSHNAEKHECDDQMQWYDSEDRKDTIVPLYANRIAQQSSNKVKIGRLDMSKVTNLKNSWEVQDTTRTVSTAAGSSPPMSPLSSHRSVTWGNDSVMYYSIATP